LTSNCKPAAEEKGEVIPFVFVVGNGKKRLADEGR
jgi:hypothetical protein